MLYSIGLPALLLIILDPIQDVHDELVHERVLHG